MFAKYDQKVVQQARRNRKKFEELKDEFRIWKKQPITEYEKYKKEDQPVIDAVNVLGNKLNDIGENVIKAIEENREVEKQLIPYRIDYKEDFPSDSEGSYFLDEYDVTDEQKEALKSARKVRKNLESQLQKEKGRSLFQEADEEYDKSEENVKRKGITDYSTVHLGVIISKYLPRISDPKFGIRYDKNYQGYYIGDSKVEFSNDDIIIKGKNFKATKGLMLFLTLNDIPNDDEYTDEDRSTYKTILKITNAMYQNNDPNSTKPKSSVGKKYNTLIKDIWLSEKVSRKERAASLTTPPKSGFGFVKKYSKAPIEYVWLDDVRELIDRLMVIHGEENAGNNVYHNEKVGITKMLTSKFNDFIVNNPKGIPYLIRFLNNIPHTFWESEKHGKGLVNWMINKIGENNIDLTLPGYKFCGPGNPLDKQLAEGVQGSNPLDEACKLHDIAYRDHTKLEHRHQADKELQKAAKERIFSKDANLSERLAATAVTGIMYGKRKMGMGLDENGWGV